MMEADDAARRVETLEVKLDVLSTSVDQRFDDVDAALVEQRRYTEFAFGQLSERIDGTHAEVRQLAAKVEDNSAGLRRLEAKVDGNSTGLGRIERKLDQFIDAQLRRKT